MPQRLCSGSEDFTLHQVDQIPGNRKACDAKAAAPAAAAPAAGVAGPKPTGEKITVAADALFDFNKAVLRPEGKAKLDELVSKAAAIKLEVILAVGHTDRLGGDAYNQKLSEKRAAAVKEYSAVLAWPCYPPSSSARICRKGA